MAKTNNRYSIVKAGKNEDVMSGRQISGNLNTDNSYSDIGLENAEELEKAINKNQNRA